MCSTCSLLSSPLAFMFSSSSAEISTCSTNTCLFLRRHLRSKSSIAPTTTGLLNSKEKIAEMRNIFKRNNFFKAGHCLKVHNAPLKFPPPTSGYVLSSTRTLFTMLFCSQTPQQCSIHQTHSLIGPSYLPITASEGFRIIFLNQLLSLFSA